MFYQYKDKSILENLIVKNASNPNSPATRRQVDQLYSCVRYCEDSFRCRRTMQLEFFGEQFKMEKCGGTCDNCKAGRVPEQRDYTTIATQILDLLTDIQRQKRNGVTLNQLSELFRGSKSQSVTKFINVSQLKGYGAGKNFKKFDLERITHTLIFERIIVEYSVQNKQGFASDYVQMGENAAAVQTGRRRFMVEFPKEVSKPSGKENNPKKKKSESSKKSKTPSKSKKPTARSRAKASASILNLDSESSDDDFESSAKSSTSSKASAPSVLPSNATQELVKSIKKLVTNWAEEERMMGKSVFYWNILSNDAMKNIASQTPTTIEELKAVGALGDAIVEEYGERIVKVVKTFVETNGLQEYIKERPAKRAKTDDSSKAKGGKKKPVIQIDEDDEFDNGIDFGVIEIPDSIPSVAGSKFFN
uniref:DNA 3'-5' helicase n=1 Tax=Entomoneis paludosa TaxID=265537 RepID=A0A7S2YF56_9STRA